MLTSLALSSLLLATPIQKGADLTAVPTGAVAAKMGYFPVPIALSTTKPAGITKEPTYATTPKYGIIKLGNGPKSNYLVALDDNPAGEYKIYIDKNQNGDLTDDGDGSWGKKREGQRPMYGVMDVTLRASYGTATRETSSAPYTIGLYHFVREGENPLLCYRESSREGSVTIDGKSHKVILVENDADGVYNKAAHNEKEATAHRPLWLQIDLNDDGKPVMVDPRAPFALGKKVYEANISDDGSSLNVMASTKPVPDYMKPKAAAAAKPLLAKGTMAPDFTCEKWGGGNLKLSDYRGHVVVLDFWATWCGPCQKSMPHIQHVYEGVKNQDVVVLGVCVWDAKDAYTKWVPQNQSKYGFQFAFDPAGQNTPNSIAAKLFHVNGIPTTYIIDKDGKVVEAVVGYDDNDKRVEAALQKAGVNVAASR